MKKPALAFFCFYFCLVFASLGEVQKYLGITWVIPYCVAMYLILLFIRSKIIPAFMKRFKERDILVLLAVTMLALGILFFTVYPVLNSGVIGGGSDRDEDLSVAAAELLKGHYPYYPVTYLGNKITHLPGSLILGIPFVLLGNGAYQNLFWLLVLSVFLMYYLKSRREGLLFFWILLALSPVILHEFLNGADLLSNGIYVLVLLFLAVGAILDEHCPLWKRAIFTFLLGLALSSRSNFLLVLVPMFFFLWQNSSFKKAFIYAGLGLITFLLVTMPFYLYDPRGFSPLASQFDKVGQFSDVLPFAGSLIVGLTVLLTVVLSLRRMPDDDALFENCFLIQLFPVVSGLILHSIQGKGVNLVFSSVYGMNFLFFGVVAFWKGFLNINNQGHSSYQSLK